MADFLEEFSDQQTKSLKGRQKTFDRQVKTIEKSALGEAKTEENKLTIKDVISQITSAMNVGSKPKREDFIDAAKELSNIQSALSEVGASDSLSFDSELLKKLQEAVQVGLDFIAEQKPSLKGAAAKGIANKMKETSTGFVKNMAMETVSGIPFGAAVVDWMGAKMSGFGESLTQGKKLTETELGIGRAFTGGADVSDDIEDSVEDSVEDIVENGGTVAGGLGSVATAGGAVATNGNGGGLTETNEILKDILEAVKPDAEAGREAERERELERLEDAKKGGAVTGKEGDKKGLFGDIFKNFKLGKFPLGQLFSKGGIGRLVTTLGTSLLGGATTAAAPTGALGKQIATSAKWGQLGKGAGVGLLVTGIAIALADGMEGYANKEKWGVGGFAAAFGGALGGADKGISGALKGAGKFALIGAGLGSIFPVVGTVIGGAIGALLGAVLGFFGGEKIAKAISDLGKWVSSKTDNILKALGLKDKTKEDHLEDIETDRKVLENKMKSAEEGGVGEGQRFSSQTQKDAFISGLKKDEENLKERTRSAEAGAGNLDVEGRADKLEELKASLPGADEDAAEAPAKILEYRKIKINPNIAAGPGSQHHTNQMIKNAQAVINRPQKIRNQIKKIESLASGGFIVNRPAYLPSSGIVVGEHSSYSGRGTPRDGGPEILIGGAANGAVLPLDDEKAGVWIDPIMKSAAGAIMNQQMLARNYREGGRGGSAPTIIDASTVQNVSNNTLIRPPSPSGPGLHFERGDFVHKIA